MFALKFFKVETSLFKTGDRVVIYNPAYSKALSGNYDGFYNQGTAVTISGETVTGFTDADVWTVTDNGDGTWSFSYNGQNIGMGDSYTSMPLGEKNDKWELVENEDGTYYIKNTVRNAYMEYQDNYGTWSGYHTINAGSPKPVCLRRAIRLFSTTTVHKAYWHWRATLRPF